MSGGILCIILALFFLSYKTLSNKQTALLRRIYVETFVTLLAGNGEGRTLNHTLKVIINGHANGTEQHLAPELQAEYMANIVDYENQKIKCPIFCFDVIPLSMSGERMISLDRLFFITGQLKTPAYNHPLQLTQVTSVMGNKYLYLT